jgi:ParB family chromosome partitioning protein
MKRNVLGRGLDALLPGSEKATLELSVEELSPNPFQPRRTIPPEELESLAASIKSHGLLQPIIVRHVDGGYQIIMGERRWRAAMLAGLAKVPVVVRDASDDQALVLALVENVQRTDLNPVEQALAYHRLSDDFSLTQEEISQLVGKDRSTVANFIRLLDLPASILTLLAENRLSSGHARALLAIPSDSVRELLAGKAADRGMSVRQLEDEIKRYKTKPPVTKKKDQNLAQLEDQLSRTLATKVKVQQSGRKGRIVLYYFSLDELDRLLARLTAQS